MKRDNFSCPSCGARPALQPGLTLHVDHVKARSVGAQAGVWCPEPIFPSSRLTSFLQALPDSLLEHGLVADTGLFSYQPGTLKIRNRDAN